MATIAIAKASDLEQGSWLLSERPDILESGQIVTVFPTQEEFEAKVNLADFLEWIKHFEDHEFVGYAHSAHSCPLSRFAVSRAFGLDAYTGLSNMTLAISDEESKHKNYNLPRWAYYVRAVVDCEQGTIPINGKRFREIVERAKVFYEQST